MLFAGVLLAPAYYFYCTQFSGEQLGKFEVSGRAGIWTLSDGSSQRFPGGRATRPFSVDLDPAMNPVGFNWHGRVSGTVMHRQEYNEYRAWLFFAGRPVMQESLSVSRDEKDSGTSRTWKSIGRVAVAQQGRYDFVLEELREPRFSVTGVQIEVRRNVLVPSTPVVICGAVLLAAGFVLIFVVLFRGKREDADPALPQRIRLDPFFAGVGTLMLVLLGIFFVLAYVNRDVPGSSPFAARPARVPEAALPPSEPAPTPASASQGTGPIAIEQAEPRIGRIGESITLRGTNFGRAQDHHVVIGGHGITVQLEVIDWNQDLIKARIPNDPRLQTGAYYYRVERVDPYESSNLFMFAFESQK